MAQFGNEWREYNGPIKEPMRAGVPGSVAGGSPTAAKRSKYGATKTEIDGIVFASKKEAKRYSELKALAAAGEISELTMQPKFPLYVYAFGDRSDPVKVGAYIGDFAYSAKGQTVIEDVKGMKTPIYRLKKKMVEALYGITVVEV